MKIIAILLIITITGYAQDGRSRSAKSGRYVTKSYADKHPSTTYTQKAKTK